MYIKIFSEKLTMTSKVYFEKTHLITEFIIQLHLGGRYDMEIYLSMVSHTTKNRYWLKIYVYVVN